MASGEGVGNALHSGKQDLGLCRLTEESTCSPLQVGLLTKGEVRLDQPKVQGQISCEGPAQYGVDFDEIFSPMVKMTTLCFMLGVVAADNLELIQLDVKTIFLHGDLQGARERLCGIRPGTSSLPTWEESIRPKVDTPTVKAGLKSHIDRGSSKEK